MCNLPDIKALTRNLVQLVGGPKQAAHICSASEAEISFWCNDTHTRVIPLDHFLLLDAATGNRGLAELSYNSGITRPAAAKSNGPPSIIEILAQLSRATGELGYVTARAAEDNRFVPREKRSIRDHKSAVANVLHDLERVIA